MKVSGKHYRTIWLDEVNNKTVCIIDQRFLPHQFVIEKLCKFNDMIVAINDMHLRGAGLMGAAAAYGMYLAALEAENSNNFINKMKEAASDLIHTRPTAVNIEWAVNKMISELEAGISCEDKIPLIKKSATAIADEEAERGRQIGLQGVSLIEKISQEKKGNTVNILTHCNAGWLAFVDYGSALSPVYEAFHRGISIHVWVDETRPRNQGASLTAWELLNEGVPHTVVTDNTGGHLMQHGMVDMVITGADRVTRCGDAANKIGTYLKALAAFDNNIPFYIAIPSSSFDPSVYDGIKEIPIEKRSQDEVKYIAGLCDGQIKNVLLTPKDSPAANYGFDVTPARLITGIITEQGIFKANEEDLKSLLI